MPFPRTVEELKRDGYEYKGSGDCKGCGVTVDWYRTPAGKTMPMAT